MRYYFMTMGTGPYATTKLIEAARLERDFAADRGWRVTPATPEAARRWVKEGGLHETALWVDDGKVRYARG